MGNIRERRNLLLIITLLLVTPFVALMAFPVANEAKTKQTQQDSYFVHAQFEEHEPIFIETESDITFYGFPGEGSTTNPYVIDGLNISSLVSSIAILDVNASFIIRNCTLESTRNLNPVIWLVNINHTTVEENVIFGGSEGILTSQARDLRILENTICDSSSGLRFINSYNITAMRNSIYGHSIGIELVYTTQSLFSANEVYSNTHRGFNVDYISDYNVFTGNLIGWNEISASHSRNAADEGSNNTWFSNSWSDYVSPGPYIISDAPEVQDIMPSLLVDVEAPWINSPADVIMGEGYDVLVTWRPRDAFPLWYDLHINTEIYQAGAWIKDEISLNLQSLEPGDYNLRLVVTDGSGNTTEDLVFASVLFVILGDIGTELVAWASALSVGVFIVVLCVFKRRP
ncbi:MAG: right-handed parallel beta-helix repeat-containing protein [Candidatus Thorarchaeota archaeon]